MAGPQTRNQIPAPGGMTSPQGPGMTPNRTLVPGHVGFEHPAANEKRRPLTQLGSAESIMGVFERKPGADMQPSDFEQANASYEELSNADPALLTPFRPLDRVPTRAAELEGGPAIMELQSENTPENAQAQVSTGASSTGTEVTGATGTSQAANPQGATNR